MKGAWGGTRTGRGGYRGRRGIAPAPALSGTCPCGGTFRTLPREEGRFLVPGSQEVRCDRCGADPQAREYARNPAPNDPSLTVEKLRLKRIAPGYYEHVNRATGTTWHVFRRTVSGPSAYVTWAFRNEADNREGGGTTFYTLAEAKEALVEYLRGRYLNPRFGWCTR